MTFADKTSVVGRQAASILELDLDGCARRYSVLPCAATLAVSNFARNSENVDSGGWGKLGVTTSPNTIANPLDAAVTADTMTEDGNLATQHRISRTTVQTFRIDQAVSLAWYVKISVGTRWAQLLLWETGGNVIRVWFNLLQGVAGNKSAGGTSIVLGSKMEQVEEQPGWYRLSITSIIDPAETVPRAVNIGLQFANGNGGINHDGDSTSAFFVYGAQVRAGLLPGKYKANAGTDIDGLGEVDDLCFNTFGTCQDTPNYLKEVRTYRFIDILARPVGAIDIYPSIKSVRYGATQLKPGGKFSVRSVVTVTLQDFAHNDSNVDNYQNERTFNQEDRGTFFGKLKERNKFYIGRPMRVLEGYLDEPFSLVNFRTREYIIENIEGPTADGVVRIIGKDILALARNDRAKAPTASTETLRAAMTSGQTTLLPQIGEAVVMFAGDKHVRIDDEIILLVSHTPTDTLNVTRAQGGTTAAAHNNAVSVQQCLTYEDEPVIDVIDDLLVNFANVPSSFIPTADWEAEETESLTGYNMETIISTPTGVTKLLQEISEITLIDLWYSDVDQEIKLKLQTPFTEVTETWDDDDNIVADSVRVKDLNDQRLSRVLIYYGRRNFARDKMEPENYEFINFEIETDKEGVNKYADEKIRTIFSSWFDASNLVQVQLTSQRLLKRFGITPIEVMFDIDAKDVETLQTGDVYDLNTRVIQDVDGSQKTTRFQITETKPVNIGHKYKYKSMAFFQDATPTSLIISVDDTDYDIFVELGGPPAAVDVTVTVNTGVNVDATNGNPAMKTDGMHPDSTLHLINNGDVRGYGGNAGVGISANAFSIIIGSCKFFGGKFGGSSGQQGGDAIFTTIDITMDNTSGNIWAGAGGGGGGDAFKDNVTAYGGGGGGGGIGTDVGNGAPGGTGEASVEPGCGGPAMDGDGVAGTDGSTSAAGVGGAAGGAGAGAGGGGGADWGDDGFVGGSGGKSGGVGGFAVRLNGNAIVWEGGNNPTQVKGDVA